MHRRHHFLRQALVVGVLLLSGCATTVPPAIDQAPPGSPDIETVLREHGGQVEQAVRWGGSILELENRADSTRLTVLALPLGAHGEPDADGSSPGRFLAVVPGFLDPMVYTQSRRVTFAGVLSGFEKRRVGDYEYDYPVLRASEHYLWSDPPDYSDEYPYWWYDPWYYPWTPYYYPRYFPHR